MSGASGPGRWDADAVLAGLDPQQQDVASSPVGPMCVLAGAGTGKTRAITHRIAYGVHAGAYQPSRVLAVTFTARAAGEMRTRLRDLGVGGVQARTFHAAALRQLSYFWPRTIGGAPPRLQPQKAGIVARAGVRLGLELDRAAVRDLAGEIEWAKVGGLTPESYPAAARAAHRDPAGLDLTAMARVLDAYETVKAGEGVIDFEDVLLITCGILADREDVADQVRAQYRHFVVDEYQDVNAVQQRLLDLWLGDRDEVCVVGDPSQTIYTFTGATPRHLLEFGRRHPDAQTVRLVRNYRSTPQVVGLANLILRQQRGTAPGAPEPLHLQAQAAPGPAPVLTAYDDEDAEASGVAAAITTLVRAGTAASDIAVLFRTNGQSAGFEQALAAAGVPYLVRGGDRFFQREEVRQARDLLRGAAVADDGVIPLPDLVRDVVAGMGWLEIPPASAGAVREQWESVAAVVRLADDLARTAPEARLRDLVTELAERAAAQHAPTVEGVTLASLHAAKGLEWDVVFLAGCSDGYLPITMAEGPDAIEEERRLMYVGLTRARRELRLTWAAARQPGGRATRRPSRFLDGAAEVLGAGARSQPRTRAGDSGRTGPRGKGSSRRPAPPASCRSCGAELATAAAKKIGRCGSCPATYDEATYERLRAWRLAVAQRDKVPAYVVFTDATLIAIAEAEPADAAALRRLSGVGAHKLDRYGAAVVALVGGAAVGDVLSDASGPAGAADGHDDSLAEIGEDAGEK